MPQRIIFLCTGNTCRSPLAEVIAADMFSEMGLVFASAGLSAVPCLPASLSSAEYAAGRGLSLAGHSSRPVTRTILADTAWFIGMTRSHAAIFRSRFGAVYGGAIGILGAPGFDLAARRESPEVEEVDDPYGLSRQQYFRCGDQITRLLSGWRDVFGAAAGDASQETQK